MEKNQKVKIVMIVLVCVLLDIVLHVVTTAYSSKPDNVNFSLLASILGTEITASLWALFAFSGVAFVYLNIRNEIPGEGVKKGLRYGTAIAILWLFAMLEGVSLFGNSIVNEFVVGLSDALPVFMLSILMSKLKIKKAEIDRPVAFMLREKIKAVSIFYVDFLSRKIYCLFFGSYPIREPDQTFRNIHMDAFNGNIYRHIICSSWQ